MFIDYREQLTRYDLYAIENNYVFMVRKPEYLQNDEQKEKVEKIIESLEKWRPVKAKVKVKVDLVPVDINEVEEDITGDIVDIIEVEVIEDIINTPLFSGKGRLGITRSGAIKLRTDNVVYMINTNTRNGERIKPLAVRNADVLYAYARTEERGAYTVIEGVYLVPVESIRKMIEEQTGETE